MANNIVDIEAIDNVSNNLFSGVSNIIDYARQEVVVYVNKHANMMFWHIGKYINEDMGYKRYSAYGSKILATLSQRLTERYGKGYTYSALSRMMKVAQLYNEEEKFATLSQALTWSHFLELVTIEDSTKRLFYQQMSIAERWSVRQLREKQDCMDYERSLVAVKPEDKIVKILEKVTPSHMESDVVLRNSYILNFLGLNHYYSEKELEDAIAKQLESFILEYGIISEIYAEI